MDLPDGWEDLGEKLTLEDLSQQEYECAWCLRKLPWLAFGNMKPRAGRDVCLDCKARERVYRTWKRHGLDREAGWMLLESQGGVCALCRGTDTPWTDLVVDHDHAHCDRKTGCASCVRGLLCPTCNSGLGMFKDRPDLLRKAANYLEGVHGEDLV